jgi:hypothetical protein
MKRSIGRSPRIDAPRILETVLRSIPTAPGQVEPSDERDRVVHDHDLLVQGSPERMIAVQPEVKTGVGAPFQPDDGERFPLEGVDEMEIPGKDVRMQPTTPGNDRIQEVPELHRQAAVPVVPH